MSLWHYGFITVLWSAWLYQATCSKHEVIPVWHLLFGFGFFGFVGFFFISGLLLSIVPVGCENTH